MDIDVLAGGVATLKNNGYKILESKPLRRSLQTYGIWDIAVNEPAKAKQTEVTQSFQLRLITDSGDSLPTKVEFSRRSDEKWPHALEQVDPSIARRYNRLSFRCQRYTGETAAAQKIKALAGREVTQTRDVFDLGILHAAGHLLPAIVRERIPPRIRKAARRYLEALNFEQSTRQVLEVLDEQSRPRYDSEDSWDSLKATIASVLYDEK